MKKIFILLCMSLGIVSTIANCFASEEKIGVSADHPAVSPAGSEVVFSADFDGAIRLWAANIDGSQLRKLSKTSNLLASISEVEPAWSPDGRQIAFASINTEGSDIWVMQFDGAYPKRLTANGANNSQPTWSPDGKKIAFVSDKAGTKDIWIMNIDGSVQSKIVALAGQEDRPSFSPSGDKIVFSETDNNSSRLMIANADGSNVLPLTPPGFQDWEPSWAANGIVFASNRDTSSEHWKLWTIQPNGSALGRVGNTIGLSPSVLRDGRIVFTIETMVARAQSSIAIFNPATGATQVAVNVQGYLTPIDIRPGKSTNKINPSSHGKIDIAILSSTAFDATKNVKQATLTFGATGSEASLSKCSKKHIDLNGDGLPDLRCRFWTKSSGFQVGSKIGIVRFVGNDGKPYEGRDAITIANTEDPDDLRGED